MSSIDDAPITKEVLIQEYNQHRYKRDHEIQLLDKEMIIINHHHSSSSNTTSSNVSLYNRKCEDLELFNKAGDGIKKFLAPRDIFKHLLIEYTGIIFEEKKNTSSFISFFS